MRYSKLFVCIFLGIFLVASVTYPAHAAVWGVEVGDQYYYTIKELETKDGGNSYTDEILGDIVIKEGSNFTITIKEITDNQVMADFTNFGTLLAEDINVGLDITEVPNPDNFTETIPLILSNNSFERIDSMWNSGLWNQTIPASFLPYLDLLEIKMDVGDFGSTGYRVYANVTLETTIIVSGYPITIKGSIIIELIWHKSLGVLEKQYLEMTEAFKESLKAGDPCIIHIEREEVPATSSPGFEIAVLIAGFGLIGTLVMLNKRKRS